VLHTGRKGGSHLTSDRPGQRGLSPADRIQAHAVVGHSELSDDTAFHAFLWTEEDHMRDLGTLSGDIASLALNINDGGQIVGASLDAKFQPRAYIWENGVMTDLNTVTNGKSGLYLLLANSVNEVGEIAGLSLASDFTLHGFLAIPTGTRHGDEEWKEAADGTAVPPVWPESARKAVADLLRSRYHVRSSR